MKDISKLGPETASEVTECPRLKEGNGSLPWPANHNNMVEPRLHQQIYDSSFQVQGTSRLTNTWVRMDTNSSLSSEDFSGEDARFKFSAPQTLASVDGWVCVERPPMTWEDALKVAQQARESVFRASSTISLVTSVPDSSYAATPVTSQASGKMHNYSQIHPRQGATYSPLPLPLPPNESASRISSNYVKARINAFESSVHQGPDLSMPKLENEKMQAEYSPAGASLDNRTSREKLRKCEDRERNPEPAASRSSAVREDYAKANHDRKMGSSRENSSRDIIAKESEVRLPDSCQASRFDKPASGERFASKDSKTGNLTARRESGDARSARRLPELQGIDVEAIENQLKQSSMADKDSVSAVEGNVDDLEDELKQGSKTERDSVPAVEGNVEALENQLKESSTMGEDPVFAVEGELSAVHTRESVNSPDQLNCGPISQELGDKMEERLPVEEEAVKSEDVASQDQKVATPEAKVESQDLNNLRSPRSSMTSPKLAPSDLPKLTRSYDSLRARKCLQGFLNPARRPFIIAANKNEKFEQNSAFGDQVTSNSMDEQFATATRKVDIIFGQKSSTEFENKQLPPLRTLPYEGKFHRRGDVSSAKDSKILGHLGSGLKQVLSGAMILVGLVALWPKNCGPVARYHVVKAGETLSSIAPGQCNDPTSNFCTINPRICDQKTIYEGQRIQLS